MGRSSPEVNSDDCDEKASASGGHLMCLVCGDTATGRHYGSVACNGCKGFFRRTIRRNYKYTCRFNNNCHIDKHNRAVCRACRYARCVKYGMKVDAVQNERDLIGKRPRTHSASNGSAPVPTPAPPPPLAAAAAASSPPNNMRAFFENNAGFAGTANTSVEPWENPKALLELLLKSEEKEKNLRETVIKETGKLEFGTKTAHHRQSAPNRKKATHNDILHSLHSQLLLVIEWAKTLAPFAELSTEDQTALLKNFASQHIVLCVAYRSINACDMLQLINDTCIPRASGRGGEPDDFYSKDCDRVMDTLVAPMRFLQLDDVEFVTMKACVLFDPVARGLSNESVMKVLDTRRKIFAALEFYVQSKAPRDPHRIGDLTFFILSPLQSLAKSISEDILVSKLSGMARIDMLMEELILEDTEPKPKHTLNLQRTLSETDDPNFAPGQSEQLESEPDRLRSSVRLADKIFAEAIKAERCQPIPSANDEMSPINHNDMTSTLSSYVFGGTLQSPLSPSNDVMFSSTASADSAKAMEEPAVAAPVWPAPPTTARPFHNTGAFGQMPRPAAPAQNNFMPQAGLNF